MWFQLALLLAQMYLGELTKPRPKKVSFEDFKKDNAPSEIRSIPYVAGTVELVPSRIWYGDFSQRAVERDFKWSDLLFGLGGELILQTITVAYKYYIGECFALCYGGEAGVNIDLVKINDRPMYASGGVDNAGGGFEIDDPQAWGGDNPPGEGGQHSWCDITRGNYTDPTNAYLEFMLTTTPNKTPALRGIALLVSRGRSGGNTEAEIGFDSGYFAAGGVGFTPHFKEWKVTVRRQPNNLATAYSKVNTIHANPMEVIYEWCTSLEFGARLPLSEINIPSFQSMAQQLYTENLGWSGKIENPTSPLDVVNNVSSQIDCVLDPSPSLGLTARLIRRDYSIGSLPILNQGNITSIERYSPGAYEDTVNKIIIPFVDINNNSTPRPGIYIDPANQRIQDGRIVPQTQDYIGVGDYPTANILATRDGRALSLPRPPLSCNVLPSFGKLRYMGEVLKFEWENPTFSKVMRILSIAKGSVSEPDYKLEMIEDQFATGIRTFGEPIGTGHTDPATGLDTAPPSAAWDDALYPPDGLEMVMGTELGGGFIGYINGGIVFATYAPGGQYARVYVTEPGGVQTISGLRLAPDSNNKATFKWPATLAGSYEFCVETYSLHEVTNGVKVCATVAASSMSVSPSASKSPSASTSPSVSPSGSASPSASQSPSASTSPSSSPSPSESSSVSPSQSTSPSSSQSPSASVSPSMSVSPSVSASPSTSPSSSISPSSSASPSAPPGPDSLSDLQLWYKGDGITGVGDGGAVTTWPDDSGNGRDGTKTGAGTLFYRLTGGPNSKPTVEFAGFSGPYIAVPDFLTSYTSGNYFAVTKIFTDPPADVQNAAPPAGDWGSSSATGDLFPFHTDSKIYDGWGTSVRKTTVDPTPSLTSYRVYEVRSASGAWSNHLDGSQLFTTATNTVGWNTAPKLGGTTTNSSRMSGQIAEIIFYNRILDDTTERKAVIHAYLNDKYGFSLPT